MYNDYLNGKLLCRRTGLSMWVPFDLNVTRFCNEDQKFHDQVFTNLVITPLGVACVCADGVGLFETNRGKEILSTSKIDGIGKVFRIYPTNKLDPENIRFNASWVSELAVHAGIDVDVKHNGTVGAMEVPAVSFTTKGSVTNKPKELVKAALEDALDKYNTDNCGCSAYYVGWEDAVEFIAERLGIKICQD